MTYALRPGGIHWPRNSEGKPSFRLEDLAAANGLLHEAAHDALSDVRATIALARLVRRHQPRLYDWLFRLRDKRKAAELLDVVGHTPVVHTSRMYPAEQGCTTLVMPLLSEPRNSNSVLVYDLRHDPRPFLELGEEVLRERLFTPGGALAEGETRLPVKSVKTNRCPALAPRSTLDQAAAGRIAIDLDACNRHWELLRGERGFAQRVAAAYGGGTEELFPFRDARLPELLFRYRARNWPETLSADERRRWERFRRERLMSGAGGETLGLEAYRECIQTLRARHEGDEESGRILDRLVEWGERLAEGIV